jgi:predicted TIM-barrel fold metal-dependent hydrolase
MMNLGRRAFLGGMAALPFAARGLDAAQPAGAQGDQRVEEQAETGTQSPYVPPSAPIIDCHIHLFDKTRPQGAPYPTDLQPGLTMLPPRYRATVNGTGIVGVIVTESSSLPEDTLWVLDLCKSDTLFVGHCGYLDFGTPNFVKFFDRFRSNRMFLGVRYRNVAGRSFERGLDRPVFVADVKTMTDAGLVMEYGGHPGVILKLADKLPPAAKIVIPHYPRLNIRADQLESYTTPLKELSTRPNVAIKLSGVTKIVDGRVVGDLSLLRGWLDQLWDLFGEDRVVYGTDYPHEDRTAPFLNVLNTAVSYVKEKSPAAQEKVFWRNSARIYRWQKRAPNQPSV